MKPLAFREHIIRPALNAAKFPASEAAVQLLLGTAITESNLATLKQEPGVALSYFQIEPASYNDCVRYLLLEKNADLSARILSACYLSCYPSPENLIWNMRLSVLIARIKYYMSPDAMPSDGAYDDLCRWYIKLYNAGGKATYTRSLPIFKEVCK